MKHNQNFKNWLQNRFNEDLPGERAQYGLAPLKRKEEEIFVKKHGKPPKPSSVLLILYPENKETYVAMIVRNDYDGVHSGQVALPGGKYEKEDKDILDTAIRETREEINVKVGREQILGKLSHLFVPVSNYIIHPFIAWLDDKPEFKPEEAEVQEILRVPLKHLASSENIESRQIKTALGYSIKAPGIPINNHFLWGATAMLMSEFLTVLKEYK